MSCPFKVSDKVVRIESTERLPEGCFSGESIYEHCRIIGFIPEVGRVYVVDAVLEPREALALSGSTIIHRASGTELGWHWSRFRKLEEVQAENRLKAAQPQVQEATP